ncbi:RuBisCO large subunit C-terminal-like domain-containing protein [Desulfopila aestuarii]|uniref:Ribulose-bisphosphate carboxylase large chain n=1 Tax=Desulfopila aestuarii DSM 18488 TaxID=1121416 RepID=A0A1M7XWI3_9BACT|nr:RuBisCO large subunit C-terminal-like domain-containing protein [Desulfopila aestuarii]SHO43090.1 ribulose-bisphosphate carboxylase large chain [Desulfopila aestuarii DSM 18488]
MPTEQIIAEYLVETPLPIEKVAAVMAGEQSCGTFTRVAGETDELRSRAAATVMEIELLDIVTDPSLESQYLQRKGLNGPFQRARVTIGFPQANVGTNLTALAATVGGNLFDIGEVSGLRLEAVYLPASFRSHFAMPVKGVAGTREVLGVYDRPLFGTIIKPNLGMSPEQTGDLVATLCDAGADFIKDDEVCASPDHAPLAARVKAVMARVRDFREKTGRNILIAFNISDETDAMRRHAELVQAEGGNCVMASLNWCGLAALQSLRASTDLIIHGHRNGFGSMSRHPLLGFGYHAYQTLYRLCGLDHLHVHGIGGKFCNPADEVAASGLQCLKPLTTNGPETDKVMPVFSSGQWAGNIATTYEALHQSSDFLFLAGGGILAHPDGPAAGVASLRQGWEALCAGMSVEEYGATRPELAKALSFFGEKNSPSPVAPGAGPA